jgi:uridylate kinase
LFVGLFFFFSNRDFFGRYVEAATAVGSNNGVKDHFGILVSRLNARLFIEALNDDANVFAEPCETLQQVRSNLQLKPIVTKSRKICCLFF